VDLSETLLTTPSPAKHPLALLHDPATIRARCAAILKSVEDGVSPSFRLDRSRLPALADRVAALTRSRFPDLNIPLHSRWRHFEAGGVDRKAELDALIGDKPVAEQARIRFDLTVVSVLLDAGAGPSWRYTEHKALAAAAKLQAEPDELLAMLDRAATPKASAEAPAEAPADSPEKAASAAAQVSAYSPARSGAASGNVYTRSEGLGVASFRAFMAGAFSSRPSEPWRADATALRHVDAAALRAIFQSSPSNPVVGVEGRAALIAHLGTQLQAEALRSGYEARPGLMFDRVTANGARQAVSASDMLAEVLRTLSPIWPSGSRVQGLPAGDVWPHRWAGSAVGNASTASNATDRTTDGWVPFHKLSQWMTYSLVEPLQWAGIQVTGLDALTGLPEYRNGGLLLDGGVIVPRNPLFAAKFWKPQEEFIIEWRALTVALIDELAVLVRQRLGKTAQELPLACILEGGTWAAGREIARELRPDGAPPLRIDSDGTIF
jgi:hypothetical protein